MDVNNISYHLYHLRTRVEKGYTTKSVPVFFLQFMWKKERKRTGDAGKKAGLKLEVLSSLSNGYS